LISTPFAHIALVWGIVPLYFGLLLNELTSDKANFRTALQTGFSFLWAGAQWLWPYFKVARKFGEPQIEFGAMLPVNLLVTFLVIALGLVALASGVRKKFPRAPALHRPHAVRELFHDRDFPDPVALSRMDVGTVRLQLFCSPFQFGYCYISD
jgi:hypothetical protein